MQEFDPVTQALTGQLAFVLIASILLTAVGSYLLLALYRRAVLRSMRAEAASRKADPRAPSTALDLPAKAPEPDVPTPASEMLYGEATRAPWRIAAIHTVAGLAFGAVMALAILVSGGMGVSPLRLAVLTLIYAWPVTLTIDQVAASSRGRRRVVMGVYFALLAAVGAVAIALSPAMDWGQLAVLWAITNLPPTLLVLAFLYRSIRAVGPVVLIFMLPAVIGTNVAISIVNSDDRLLRAIVSLQVAVGAPAGVTIFGMALFGFVVIGAPVGWLVVKRIRRAYEEKAMSDQMLTIDAIWLLFAVAQSIGLVFEGPWWILSGLVAFVVFKLVGRVGFGMLAAANARRTRGAPRLLLLRVFSLGKRSQRLFDALEMRWRHVGTIRLIAGPDLATTTIEPHEFLDFLTGRLARRFIDGPETLNLRMWEMDEKPDRDGRFRVHDFYCYNDTWTMVLRRLVRDSNAVLMDLRGFTAQNAGCLFEVNELIDVAPLDRVRVLVDDSTDEPFLRRSVEQFWSRMRPDSPNRGASPDDLPLLRIDGSGDRELRRLLREVCDSAGSRGRIAAGSGTHATLPGG